MVAALDGELVVRGAGGERVLTPDQFFLRYLTTAVEPSELLVELRLPATPAAMGSAFVEVSRRHGDFALVGVAATVTLDAGGACTAARLALTGVGPTPVLAQPALAPLLGAKPARPRWRRSGGASRPRWIPTATSTRRASTGVTWPACSRAARSRGRRSARQPRRAGEDHRDDGATIRVTVNGKTHEKTVEARKTLADFLRDDLELTGTHLGCEHGVCGACTVVLDGAAVRSCLTFAVQVNGREIQTVEGLADGDRLNPLQEAFREHHGLQCGFCTPGFLMTLTCFLRDCPEPTEAEVREAISGNLCRCTGYKNIVAAALAAARTLAAAR